MTLLLRRYETDSGGRSASGLKIELLSRGQLGCWKCIHLCQAPLVSALDDLCNSAFRAPPTADIQGAVRLSEHPMLLRRSDGGVDH